MTEETTDNNTEATLEASFESIEITPSTSKLVSAVTTSSNNRLEMLMAKAINLSETQVYHEPTCLICSSPYREEMEQIMLAKKSNKEVMDLYKGKTGEDIGDNVVAVHADQHMKSGIREKVKSEYVHRVQRLDAPNVTTLDKISFANAVILERIMGINSIVPTGEESAAKIEQIKSAETNKLMGTYNNLLKLQASILGEMKTSGELVYIPTNEFVSVFRDALRSAKTPREKELINDLLNKMESIARKTQ